MSLGIMSWHERMLAGVITKDRFTAIQKRKQAKRARRNPLRTTRRKTFGRKKRRPR